MSNSNKLHNVDWRKLTKFVTEALARAGFTPEDAAVTADTIVEADLRGVESHGVVHLGAFIKMVSEGNMNPRPNLSIVRETPIMAVIDADNGMGNLVCIRATEMAIQKANNSGVGIIAVRRSTHCGALAYYSMMALKHDMIGFITTNGPPLVPAYGGITRLLTTNPYSFAIPTGQELPVVIDMATTVAARGKIRLKANAGEKIPLGWALDRYGQPTEDAREALDHGFSAWMGGPKGYSLAVLSNILSGVLSGCSFGVQNYPHYDIQADYGTQLIRMGHFIAVLRINEFMPVDKFKDRMDVMIREIKASEPAKGFTRVYLPGEPEFEQKTKRMRTGIPLSPVIWQSLLEVKEKFGLLSLE